MSETEETVQALLFQGEQNQTVAKGARHGDGRHPQRLLRLHSSKIDSSQL